MVPVIIKTFDDIVQTIAARVKIAGSVQTKDLEYIRNVVNEYYVKISTERSWKWRSFDRSFNFDKPITTGSASVTLGSREVTMTGLTVSRNHLFRSLKFGNQRDLYRIVGFKTSTNKFYLDAAYVGATNTATNYKMYQYEFALPPDCDTLNQVYLDDFNLNYDANVGGELDEVNNVEFNRILSVNNDMVGTTSLYTNDGDYPASSLPALDHMVLNYDFLATADYERINRIRLFPIEPDVPRLIHIAYSRHLKQMVNPDDEPLIPVDDRSILVHFGISEWRSTQGDTTQAKAEFEKATLMLSKMRQEYHKTDSKPKIVVDGRRYMKRNRYYYNRREWMFRASRIGEY